MEFCLFCYNKIMLKKGFTIIELIITVAIISVLAVIVLVNVVTYINKGKDSAIMHNMMTMVFGLTSDHEGCDDYSNFLSDPRYTVPRDAIIKILNGTGPTYSLKPITSDHLCVCVPLKTVTNDSFCFDDSGYRKQNVNVGGCGARCAFGVCGD